MVRFGPIIKGAFSAPIALARKLAEQGRPVPDPVRGYLIIDTGAVTLCVADFVPKQLGLSPVGIRDTAGVHGVQKNEVYHLHLQLMFSGGSGEGVSIETEKPAICIPGLHGQWSPDEMKTNDAHPSLLIGLLGRDFLRHAVFTYNGATGVIDVMLDLTTMPPRPRSS